MFLTAWPAYGLFFFLALLIYGFFGSPTPDSPGVAEGLIGICLAAAIGITGLSTFFHFKSPQTKFLLSLQFLFLSGMIGPIFSALYFGNDLGLILRDMAAFLFLGLPLFFSHRLSRHPAMVKTLLAILILCGFVFSVRTLIPVFNIWIPDGELLYLSNSPLVIFACVFLIGRVWSMFEELRPDLISKTILYLGLVGIMLLAMLLDMQRATVGAVFLSLLVFIVFDLWVKPKKAMLPLFLMCSLVFILWPWMLGAVEGMALKTAQVGMNARISEATAVYATIQSDVVSLLFGRGWGAVFSSPAVAGLDVNFTHSWLTTIFLKGGVALTLPALFLVFAALYEIFLIFQRDRVLSMALAWAFLIPVFLYASHKSIDFGLILLMISVWRFLNPSWTNPQASDKNEAKKISTK